MGEVVLSQIAEDDLLEIWLAITTDDVAAADNFLEELHVVTQRLALQPLMGRIRPDVGPGLRSFPHRDYLVFYRPTVTGVGVARIVHGNRDLARLDDR